MLTLAKGNSSHALYFAKCARVGQWAIEVEDNGQGIEKKQQSKIFDIFYRANEASDGSGLFIVAEAVEKLNGNIEVQSKVNVGKKITIRFRDAD